MISPAASSDTIAPQFLSPELKRVFVVGAQACAAEVQILLTQYGFAVIPHACGGDFMATDHRDQIGCLLIGARNGDESAVRLLDHAKMAAHRLAIVVLAEGEQVRLAVHAFRAGAHDVLQRPVDAGRVVNAIHSALGALNQSPAFAQVLERQAALEALAGLTYRQRDILDRIVQGQSNRCIAADMGVSQRTIDNHRAAIMKRMGVSSAPALIRKTIAGR